jgi:hypothetical protein
MTPRGEALFLQKHKPVKTSALCEALSQAVRRSHKSTCHSNHKPKLTCASACPTDMGPLIMFAQPARARQ